MTDERAPPHCRHCRFGGRLLMIGFGCIGRGVLPLLLRHIEMAPQQITILCADDDGWQIAQAHGVTIEAQALTRENYSEVLARRIGHGDFLLNLSVDVGSTDLVAWCRAHGAAYLDAAIEPWSAGHFDATIPPAERTNHALRAHALALRNDRQGGPTAVVMHGVNPGLVSHFVKQALLDLAAELLPRSQTPCDRAAWAELARRLSIRAIHVAERDTQVARRRKTPGEFVNTWSTRAFAEEACQPAELGWGSHERHWPAAARRHACANAASIWLERPGAATRVRSWTPRSGGYHGFLITHGESISIAEYLSIYCNGQLIYRPTVHYAYHPCDDALLSLHELAGRNWRLQARHHELAADEIVSGDDELGVLLLGHARQAYWYGSRLSIAQARRLCPHNTATSLQTAAGVLAGVVWAIRHPDCGIVEPDEMDFREALAVATPYLGEMIGVYSDWTPLQGRNALFAEAIDADDPWQFCNVLVD